MECGVHRQEMAVDGKVVLPVQFNRNALIGDDCRTRIGRASAQAGRIPRPSSAEGGLQCQRGQATAPFDPSGARKPQAFWRRCVGAEAVRLKRSCEAGSRSWTSCACSRESKKSSLPLLVIAAFSIGHLDGPHLIGRGLAVGKAARRGRVIAGQDRADGLSPSGRLTRSVRAVNTTRRSCPARDRR